MLITKLRLIGFKSFVEPTELLIEPGLTAVVGPNGCGKSNLLEALRWVMGETSYKSMRASAMDDVIFSGTNDRPARNMAEVSIFLDNSERRAPAEFNDADQIEIVRRIEREAGSAYRINGSEVRARDVKILFEDAATGARSPALVRQGQIGEIVNAKPEQRRRSLEDAAGTAGLHSRRHEAELRLRAAENNLVRIGDVVGQLKSQIDSLKRQARQAKRYSELSGEIRAGEALQIYLTWSAAQSQVDHDEAALQVALEALGAATAKESAATRHEAELADSLQPLREEEVTRAAVLARLTHEQTNVDNEVRRARQRAEELEVRGLQLVADIERETVLVAEAGQLRDNLAAELEALGRDLGDDEGKEAALRESTKQAETQLAESERRLAELTTAQSEARAQLSSAEAQVRERSAQLERLTQQQRHLSQQIAAVMAAAPDAEKLAGLQAQSANLMTDIAATEEAMTTAEEEVGRAQDQVRAAQTKREQARLALRQVETERLTLAKLIQAPDADAPAIVDQITVAKGYEVALGAALGDDLDAPIGMVGVVHWRQTAEKQIDRLDDAQLPDGVEPLSDYVEAPAALLRRLRQIGVVAREQGEELQPRLLPGQRLVSKEGDLWRWDGFVAPAEAPTAAAQRLAARNRLDELASSERDAKTAAEVAEAAAEDLAAVARAATTHEQELRQRRREQQAALMALSKQLAEMERAARETEARLAALREAAATCEGELEAAQSGLDDSTTAVAALPAADYLEDDLAAARSEAMEARDRAAGLRAEVTGFVQERQRKSDAQQKAAEDHKRWTERAAQGDEQIAALKARLAETRQECEEVSSVPNLLEARRHKLLNELSEAEAVRRAAADKLAEAEAALKEANGAMRAAQAEVSEQREMRARADARLEAARTRRAEIVRQIQETFDVAPEGCLALAGYEADDETVPSLADAEARLMRLRTDRDRLGGVNLQAGEELEQLTEQYDTLDGERADVEEAIAKLRAGIASLNREGRKRLKEAFESVDGHFQTLFTTLFGGGEAKLEMVDNDDDPLAGGLEIIARPPGKKPTTLSLLSGGEQSLTALSLIFAVFLTNPSPICVLDEVDAPLDDANVDRFCTLMEKMSADTDTRFLVITHHPMTMARVDRLFGVTMVERGISQLVSVDLAAAEQFLEAG